MKVLLINGSPHKKGCTYTALMEVAKALEGEGVDWELFQLGTSPVRGCSACGGCRDTGRCVFNDDCCNELIDKMAAADGIVVGSPVHYSGPAGALCAVLDRVFYAAQPELEFKPAAAVVSCRRGGASAAFDRLNKYFTINKMPVVTSQYWNSVHGGKPEDVLEDQEGLQTMRTLGQNMAWLLRCVEGSEKPKAEPRKVTSFVR